MLERNTIFSHCHVVDLNIFSEFHLIILLEFQRFSMLIELGLPIDLFRDKMILEKANERKIAGIAGVKE